jgi:hypothetical protein
VGRAVGIWGEVSGGFHGGWGAHIQSGFHGGWGAHIRGGLHGGCGHHAGGRERGRGHHGVRERGRDHRGVRERGRGGGGCGQHRRRGLRASRRGEGEGARASRRQGEWAWIPAWDSGGSAEGARWQNRARSAYGRLDAYNTNIKSSRDMFFPCYL